MKASAKNVQSESDMKGKPIPADGFHHVTIIHVNDSRVKKDGSVFPYTVVEFEVLAGSVPGQEDKTVSQFYALGQNGEETAEYCEKVSRLCLAAGILKPGEEKDVDLSDLENAQVVIKSQSYEKKDKTIGCGLADYGLGVWGVGHPEVASVPKNSEAIRLWREANGPPAGGNGQSGNGSDEI